MCLTTYVQKSKLVKVKYCSVKVTQKREGIMGCVEMSDKVINKPNEEVAGVFVSIA